MIIIIIQPSEGLLLRWLPNKFQKPKIKLLFSLISSIIIKQSFHQRIEAIHWRFHALPYKKTPYFSKLQFIVPQGIGLTPA